MFAVVVVNLLSVIHATVTDLDCDAVEDFFQPVIFRKYLPTMVRNLLSSCHHRNKALLRNN